MNSQSKFTLPSLRYRARDIEVIADAPFKNDKLGREPFVIETVNLLKVIQEPFVIALNAPWGSGKTTTLRMLEPSLDAAGISTVSFNAWEVDYATDPLVPLVASLHDQLLSIKRDGLGLNHSKVTKLKKLGSTIVKHGSIAAVKFATAGLLDTNAAIDGIDKVINEAAEGLTYDIIDAFKQEKLAAQRFRSLLCELTAHVRLKDEVDISPPLVLLIDELDRCRPTFAIAMLERIKHFFNTPGLVFVLAIDLDQLKAGIRKVYGIELDATEYLRRFFDLELRLPQADVGDMADAMLTSCGADAFFEARTKYPKLRNDRTWAVRIINSCSEF